MLWASAKSVREERSKQRFALQDFALSRVSLVRGKGGWRVGSAECERNYFTDGGTKSARGAVTSIIKLLRQFLHGEVAQPILFDDAKTALAGAADAEESDRIVAIFTLRLLHQLGYIAAAPEFAEHLSSPEWCKLPELPKTALNTIEKAKSASHL